MPDATISAIITSYNCAEYIGDAIESVLAQSHPVDEVVVIDDGSKDDIAAIVKRYPSVRFIQQENQGPAAARNRGISETSGDYVTFLDCDDIWQPEKTARQLAYLTENQDVVMVSGGKIWWDTELDKRHDFVFSEKQRMNAQYEILFRNCIGNPSMVMIRRIALEDIGGFDTRYPWGQDWELWIRMVEYGRVGYLPDHVIIYRWHPSNLSQRGNAIARYNCMHDISRTSIRRILPLWKRPLAYMRSLSIKQLRLSELAAKHGNRQAAFRHASVALIVYPFDSFTRKLKGLGRSIIGKSQYKFVVRQFFQNRQSS